MFSYPGNTSVGNNIIRTPPLGTCSYLGTYTPILGNPRDYRLGGLPSLCSAAKTSLRSHCSLLLQIDLVALKLSKENII
jgi:hypothetical protein